MKNIANIANAYMIGLSSSLFGSDCDQNKDAIEKVNLPPHLKSFLNDCYNAAITAHGGNFDTDREE